MIKKTLKFTDFNGVEREQDFYFHLMESEVAEMNLSIDGGLSEKIQRITQTQNIPELIKLFKEIILASYGVKSPDGLRFIKNDQLREEFAQTQAYSDLFMLLARDDKEAAAFINGIAPTQAPEVIGTPAKKKATGNIQPV